MKIYIIDDDINIIKMLENIIESSNLGDIVGYQTNSTKVIEDLLLLKPNIVIIDFLMPKIDGSQLIKNIESHNINSNFIMLSQVDDKDMIGEVYDLGIEFFINKPINKKEIICVLNNVIQKIKFKQKIDNIESIIQSNLTINRISNYENDIKVILNSLGISSEKGSYDIIKILNYILTNNLENEIDNLNQICLKLNYKPKTVKQRMRRAMNKALNNLAHEGLENYNSEHFLRFSKSIFDFESIREQMEFIKGNRKKGGSVNLKKFLIGLSLKVQ